METLFSDIRQALRGLGRSPGFAIAAVGILALGIAANTAVFSVADAVLFRPLPYQHPEQLVLMNEIIPRLTNLYPTLPVNARHFYIWKERSRSFADMAILKDDGVDITASDGPPERLGMENVSFNLLPLLGVQPLIGRNFTAEEDHPGNDREVILTEPLWRRRFHSDPEILNKTILLDGVPNKVIGVLPASFRFLSPNLMNIFGSKVPPTQLFKPIAFTKDRLEEVQGDYNYAVIGRLRPGVTREQALAEMNALETAIDREFKLESDLRAAILPMQEHIVSGSRRGLLVLLASIGAVLLIVCVNLGNLMLARTTARGRELAVRAALGAGSWRIVRQVLTESLVISFSGGLLGIGLAYAAVRFLVSAAPVDVPRLDEVRLDTHALLFAFGAAMLAGLLFGLIPSWRASRAEPQDALRSGGRGSTQGRQGLRISEALISAEVALSATLLVAAGLLVGSLSRILATDQGFHADNVLTAKLNLSSSKYDEQKRIAFIDRVLPSVQALPGVRAAASISALPLEGETWIDMITRDDDHRPVFQRPLGNYRIISPDYFRVMEISIIQGRAFEPADRDRDVEIVSARTAARIWPGQNPIGKRIRRGSDREPFAEVIGVAADTRAAIALDSPLMVYRTYWKTHNSGTTRNFSLVIRTSQNPESAATAVRNAIWAIDSELPVPEITSMRQVIHASVAQQRFQTTLLGAFALAALLLAVVGIYGVISYSVNRRRNEIGIRMALGAQTRDVNAMVLRQGMRPVAIGLVVGLAAALALGRLLGALLYEIRPSNPAVLVSVAVALSAAAALACYIPARRATAVDPAAVLRYE
jgi:putative ABC transport system permease protein